MFGENPRLSPLELRKQLLIAESELNRAQLAGDLAVLTARVRAVAGRAKSFGTIASSAAVLVTGLAAFQRGKTADAGRKRSWLHTILKAAGVSAAEWKRAGISPRNPPAG